MYILIFLSEGRRQYSEVESFSQAPVHFSSEEPRQDSVKKPNKITQ